MELRQGQQAVGVCITEAELALWCMGVLADDLTEAAAPVLNGKPVLAEVLPLSVLQPYLLVVVVRIS